LLLFSYDVIINGKEKQILDLFDQFKARVVFSAESFCWPDATLEVSSRALNREDTRKLQLNTILIVNLIQAKYPEVAVGKRFLNSGGEL
jgi:hypothetical protein